MSGTVLCLEASICNLLHSMHVCALKKLVITGLLSVIIPLSVCTYLESVDSMYKCIRL